MSSRTTAMLSGTRRAAVGRLSRARIGESRRSFSTPAGNPKLSTLRGARRKRR
jgi:hypothetical protein